MDNNTILSNEALLRDQDLHPKVKRAFLFLEDEEWDRADEYFEAVLDEDPTNAYAYLGKLMVSLKASKIERLTAFSENIETNKYYTKALRFSNEKLSPVLEALKGSTEKETEQRKEATSGKSEGQTGKKKSLKFLYIIAAVAFFVLMVVLFRSPAGEPAPAKTSKLDEAEAFLAKGNFRDAGAIMQEYGFSDEERAQKIWSRTTGRKTTAKYSNGIDEYTLTVKSDGTVSASGKNTSGRINVGNWTNIVAVAAGEKHSVGLRADGTVVATGSNSDGQCNVQSWKNVVYIGADRDFTIGFTADGEFLFTGKSTYVLRGGTETYSFNNTWNDLVRVVDGGGCFAGLKANGTVVATGRDAEGQCEVGRWKDIVSINAGYWYVSGKQKDGMELIAGKK